MARKNRQSSRSRAQPARGRSKQAARAAVTQAQPQEVEAPPLPPVTDERLAAQPVRTPRARAARPYQHRGGRRPVATARAVAANASTLPRDVEYGYIRADLRRLLVTAGVLAVGMVALLLVLGS
jgi:uncharacterized membrane protein